MKKIIALFLLSTLLSGCATYNVAHMRETKKGNLSEIFSNSKEEVYAAVKSALAETDLIIRKENFERGEILATPNRLRSIGKRLGSAIFSYALMSSYIGVYFFITPQKNNKTKLEIVQVYDNPLNTGKEYKTALMESIREKLK